MRPQLKRFQAAVVMLHNEIGECSAGVNPDTH
jgi:hypothetical protein